MADITRYPFLHHLRAAPTAHIHALRRGHLVHSETGAAFWFRPLAAAISEIPIDDREQPLFFHARTAEFTDVTVQATITYRIADPATAAARIDFGIDPRTGAWRSRPLEQLGGLLAEQAQQHAIGVIARLPLDRALSEGMTLLRDSIGAGLAGDRRLTEIGVAVVDVRVIAVRAEPDVENALQTPARESVQATADRATYERRAGAVEQERAIAENELHNQIELARREQELIARQGLNDRRRADEEAAVGRIRAEADAATTRLRGQADADRRRMIGEADADAERALLGAYGTADPRQVLAAAVKEFAAHVPEIGHVHLTPELLTELADGLLARSDR